MIYSHSLTIVCLPSLSEAWSPLADAQFAAASSWLPADSTRQYLTIRHDKIKANSKISTDVTRSVNNFCTVSYHQSTIRLVLVSQDQSTARSVFLSHDQSTARSVQLLQDQYQPNNQYWCYKIRVNYKTSAGVTRAMLTARFVLVSQDSYQQDQC